MNEIVVSLAFVDMSTGTSFISDDRKKLIEAFILSLENVNSQPFRAV